VLPTRAFSGITDVTSDCCDDFDRWMRRAQLETGRSDPFDRACGRLAFMGLGDSHPSERPD